MYKKINLSLLLFFFIVLVSACSNKSTFKSEISLPLQFPADESTQYFSLEGNKYEVLNEPAAWLTVSEDVKDNQRRLAFTATKNSGDSERTTVVLVKIGHTDYTFMVKQFID